MHRVPNTERSSEVTHQLIPGSAREDPHRGPIHGERPHDLHRGPIATEGEHGVMRGSMGGGEPRRIPARRGAHEFHRDAGVRECAPCLAFASPAPPRGGVDDEQRRPDQNRQSRKRSKPNCLGVGANPRALASREQRTALVGGSIPNEKVRLDRTR